MWGPDNGSLPRPQDGHQPVDDAPWGRPPAPGPAGSLPTHAPTLGHRAEGQQPALMPAGLPPWHLGQRSLQSHGGQQAPRTSAHKQGSQQGWKGVPAQPSLPVLGQGTADPTQGQRPGGVLASVTMDRRPPRGPSPAATVHVPLPWESMGGVCLRVRAGCAPVTGTVVSVHTCECAGMRSHAARAQASASPGRTGLGSPAHSGSGGSARRTQGRWFRCRRRLAEPLAEPLALPVPALPTGTQEGDCAPCPLPAGGAERLVWGHAAAGSHCRSHGGAHARACTPPPSVLRPPGCLAQRLLRDSQAGLGREHWASSPQSGVCA